ncbi:MAG: starch-binding protein [Clostridiales bacterium]|nr:starch-binding protein [Clostridiales bacterium]
MKKLACFCISLCLALAALMTVPALVPMPVAAEENDAAVVYVYDEQEWNLSVYCYANGVDFGPGWPGTELNRAPEIGDDWYSFVLPDDPTGKSVTMIIFDSANDQVNRVTVAYNKSRPYLHTYGETSFATKDAAQADAVAKRPKLVDTIYIYNYSIYDEAERWENISASCYDNKTGDALGESVTLEADSTLGAHWYKYNLPDEAKQATEDDYKFRARVVVSDGEGSRERLIIVAPVEATKYYNTYRDYGFKDAKTAADDEFNCVYSDPKTGTTRLYYYNTQRWKTVYAYAYWTYAAANNTLVEDFGSWPGKMLREVDGHENWYYIDLPQDPTKVLATNKGVGIVFNCNTKGRIKQDAFIDSTSNVYVNYEGKKFASFAACEAVSTMIAPLPAIEDYMLDFESVDTSEKTVDVTEYKPAVSASLTAPIVVLSIAGAVCIAVGAVFIIFTVRRKKK